MSGRLGGSRGYDAIADSWRSLPPAPIRARAPLFVWTGQELIVWGSTDRTNFSGGERPPPRDGAAYSPATNTWRQIAMPPIELTDATAVWTGPKLILFEAMLDAYGFADTETAIGVAYHPSTDTWRRLPDSTLSPQASTAAWNGRELIAVDTNHHSAAYDPVVNTWRPLPDAAGVASGNCVPQSASINRYVVGVICGATVVFDPADGAWHDVSQPGGDGFSLVAADPVVLLLGRNTSTDGAIMLAYLVGR